MRPWAKCCWPKQPKHIPLMTSPMINLKLKVCFIVESKTYRKQLSSSISWRLMEFLSDMKIVAHMWFWSTSISYTASECVELNSTIICWKLFSTPFCKDGSTIFHRALLLVLLKINTSPNLDGNYEIIISNTQLNLQDMISALHLLYAQLENISWFKRTMSLKDKKMTSNAMS